MAGGFCMCDQLVESASPIVHGAVSSLEKASLTEAMKGLPNWFMALWCVLMPLTSFLLIPSVQGTIPAYILAFVSVFFVIVSRERRATNYSANPLLHSSPPSGGDSGFCYYAGANWDTFSRIGTTLAICSSSTQRHTCRVPLRALYAESLSGCLRLHRLVLSFLLSRRVDALCPVGRVVSGDLRDL